MIGELTLTNDSEVVPCEFTITIESNDVQELIENDPKHKASIAGTVTCKYLSDEPLTVSSGNYS